VVGWGGWRMSVEGSMSGGCEDCCKAMGRTERDHIQHFESRGSVLSDLFELRFGYRDILKKLAKDIMYHV
jgi:hypothetical protein